MGAVAATVAAPALPAAAQGGALFFPIEPYRLFDSRLDPDGPILSGEVWTFWGVAAPGVQAITYNLTVVGTVGRNWISVYPGDAAFPGVSSINWWTSGLILANAATVALGASEFGTEAIIVQCGGQGGSTHYIIDITGWFAEVVPAVQSAESARSPVKHVRRAGEVLDQ